MKLLITIVQDQDVPALLEALTENGFRATKLASTGGFLRVGNTTLLIGIKEDERDAVFALVKKTCKRREQPENMPKIPFGRAGLGAQLDKVLVGGATIFVVDVERFERI
ncbi:MAG: cyclic-di-AMP receptor [Bacillota bacterium]|nr:cyclic-di-AMP receptor [Bacillota bacterium]HHU60508.1 hypothetical protein [Natronincola sp.]